MKQRRLIQAWKSDIGSTYQSGFLWEECKKTFALFFKDARQKGTGQVPFSNGWLNRQREGYMAET